MYTKTTDMPVFDAIKADKHGKCSSFFHFFCKKDEIYYKKNLNLPPTRSQSCQTGLSETQGRQDRAGRLHIDGTEPRKPFVRAASGKAFTDVTILCALTSQLGTMHSGNATERLRG